MARIQVSLRIPGTAPMPELIKLIQQVEAAGFDGAGILDSQLLCRDTFVTMALAATHTSALTLFPAVTNPLTRHASVLAGAIVHQALLSARSHWLPHTGLTLPRFDIPPAVRAIYPDLAHARDWEQAIAATSFVPDDVIAELCDTFGLVGTAEHCARRIGEMTAAGATKLYVQAFQTFVGPEQEMRTFRDEVFPRLKAAGYR